MKQTLLLVAVMAIVSIVNAQKKVTAYAITGVQKGHSNWSEIRLVDIVSGEEVKSIYQSAKEVDIFNARTGKPIVKKPVANNAQDFTREINSLPRIGRIRGINEIKEADNVQGQQMRRVIITDRTKPENITDVNVNISQNTTVNLIPYNSANGSNIDKHVVYGRSFNRPIQMDRPFATNSAALAYDQKHERLYYTPMNIAQLRYIDLKTGKVYFFEDEAFGTVKGRGDVQNQITRMVIASDGNGYAITNDANHLIRFTTGKKPVITDLGALTDDASNGSYSIHNSSHFGGDVIADVNKNLYLISADRSVYKIQLESKVASYLGSIKGLPRGFTTNGAVVEGGSKVIVTSSTQTIGYYRFDLNTLEAEKISTGTAVYNASDLANGTLAFTKEESTEAKDVLVAKVETPKSDNTKLLSEGLKGKMSVFPNPVRNGGAVKVSFADQLPGKYQIQLLDAAGQIVTTKSINVNSKLQVEEFQLPQLLAYGNYVVKVVGSNNKLAGLSKVVVQ